MLVTGYMPEWSVAEGESFTVHVACASSDVHLHIRRHSGPITKPGDWALNTSMVTPVEKFDCGKTNFKIDRGSRFRTKLGRETNSGCLLTFGLRLTNHASAAGVVATIGNSECCCKISVTETFRLSLSRLEDGTSVDRVSTQARLQPLRWYSIELHLHDDDIHLSVTGRDGSDDLELGSGVTSVHQLTFGAAPGEVGSRCRIGHPTLHDSDGTRIAQWDLARSNTHPMIVSDGQRGQMDATLEGAPRRSMPSADWTGEAATPLLDREQYNAADFSDEDLEDANWPVLTRLTAPTESGIYSIVLSTHDEIEWTDRTCFDALPLFVTPGNRPRARVAFVVPTFSYQAYANNTFWQPEEAELFPFSGPNGSAPLYAAAGNMGLKSLYCLHADGSGIALASKKRPQMTIRADFRSQLLGVPHQFAADLNILAWLQSAGIDFDILTDEDLDEASDDLLQHYDVLVTGSHPEYCSRASLAAYDVHRKQGGSILYSGGNGFYWRICRHSDAPHLIEVVRSEGVRTWTAAFGETHHALDQSPGGLCRNFSPTPEELFGNSFSAMGFSGDGAYQADPGLDVSRLPQNLSDFFQRVSDQPFGVAGLELDGTRAGGFRDGIRHILARSIKLPSGYVPAIEDVASLDLFANKPAEKLSEMAQGQIVLVEHEAGGLGLSIGSIRWAAGLQDNNDERRCGELMMAGLKDMLDRPKPNPWVGVERKGAD